MRRPCDISLTGCPGVDAPITNISAEAPDTLLFASTVWDPYRPFRPPILGDAEYNDTDCNSIFGPLWAIYDPVVYAETQLLANLIALATQLGCGHPDVPPEDPTAPTQVYINDAQTQSVFCPDGSEFSYTVEAGTLTSPPMNSTLGPIWVDWANAWASAYALEQASALMDCVTRPEQPPGITPGGHTDPIIPPPPGGGGTPLLDERFYWCCLGDTLDDVLNTYTFGGRGNLEYTITVTAGAIPPGTTFTQTGPRTCLLSGTPTQAGNWAWQIHAVSTTFPTVTIDVWDNLFVFGLTNGALPDATEGTPYPAFQFTAAGGNGPNYTFTSTDLPIGFSLTSDGVLTSDDTTEEGDYTFTVRVTDELGAYCDQDVSISVVAADECMGAPSVIGDITWSISFAGVGSYVASMVGGTGSFDYTAPINTSVLDAINFDCQFCNPTDDAITLDVRFTYVSGGNALASPTPIGSVAITVNGGSPTSGSGNASFLTDLPQPIWSQNVVPAHSVVNLRIIVFTNVTSTNPAFNWHSTSNIALTVVP